MFKAAEQGYLDIEDIENFPCTDLRTIDQLWVKYSDGKFGFSVQKKIYQSILETKSIRWENFGEKVGWTIGDRWLRYNDLTFERDTSKADHLPSNKLGRRVGDFHFWRFFSRAETCKL